MKILQLSSSVLLLFAGVATNSGANANRMLTTPVVDNLRLDDVLAEMFCAKEGGSCECPEGNNVIYG